jgi:hypothetical protein
MPDLAQPTMIPAVTPTPSVPAASIVTDKRVTKRLPPSQISNHLTMKMSSRIRVNDDAQLLVSTWTWICILHAAVSAQPAHPTGSPSSTRQQIGLPDLHSSLPWPSAHTEHSVRASLTTLGEAHD